MKSDPVPRRILAQIVALACCCFLASLCLPCLYLGRDGSPFFGIVLFLFGPLGILGGVVAWYANPLLPLMLILLWMRKFRLVVLCGVPCLALALSTLAMREMLVTERPDYEAVTGYGPGFYLWLASLAIPTVASSLLLSLSRAHHSLRKAALPPGCAAAK